MKAMYRQILQTVTLFSLCAVAAAQTVTIAGLAELSGAGATSGTHFRAGAELAAKEINGNGGILGKKFELNFADTQSNPGVAKALAIKAVDDGAYAVLGPIFSGSVLVSSEVLRQASVPNLVGGEATSITEKGNAYVFRTSFSQASAMPKVARYIAEDVGAKSVVLTYVNNDFGKGGRDALAKELTARGIAIAADIPTDPGQLDFSTVILKARQSKADILFVYYTVDESARFLLEARKQAYDKPILGETTIMQQSVIALAGAAADGARGHVGLTIDAPNPLVRSFAEKFEKEYGFKPSHDGIKGYTSLYIVAAVTEKIGKFDGKAFAQAMKNVRLSAKDYPGVLLDVAFDDKGDLDRESYIVEVRNGKQFVIRTLPPMARK